MGKYIWYKRKVVGPIGDLYPGIINQWKMMVDSGALKEMPDTPPMNDDMINYPWDAHVIQKD